MLDKQSRIEIAKIGGRHKGGSRPTVKPTDDQLSYFYDLAQAGYDLAQAADLARIATSYAEAKLPSLHAQAVADYNMEASYALREHFKKNAIACIFALKARAGWQETSKVVSEVQVDLLDRPSEEDRQAWLSRQAKLALPT